MDRELIARKLETVRRHVERIESKKPLTLEKLESDADLQDIIAMNLTQAVQASVDIGMHIVSDTATTLPETMAEVFDRLAAAQVIPIPLAQKMKSAVGFRNVAVHAYGDLDWHMVLAICDQHLEDFREFAQQMAKYLLREDGP
jgi:uncharacterized protein YutE (UPF0331/DUF86 family)